MFGDHFYHSITRKAVAVFGTLFNDINVVRKNSSGNVVDQQKVPLSYGPKQKYLSRIDDEPNLQDPRTSIKLPRMSFEITNMTYDSTSKLSPFNKISTAQGSSTKTTIKTVVPYILNMQLSIMAKNQDDSLQILEQIIPHFQPTYNIAVKFIDGIDESFDVPITLDSVSLSDEYEGDYTSRRVIVYTIDFTMKIRYFGQKQSSSIIKEVITTFTNNTDSPNKYLQTLTVTPDPTTATSQETMTGFNTAINFIPPNNVFSISDTAPSDEVDFQVGEEIIGLTSGVSGTLVNKSFDIVSGTMTINLNFVDGYFQIGETIRGETSQQTIVVETYTVS